VTIALAAMRAALAPPTIRLPRNLPRWCFVRLVREPGTEVQPGERIRGPGDVFRLMRERVASLETEAFYVISLGSSSQVRVVEEATRGILNSSLVHPREVFRSAILAGAAGIIVVHNHPSGDPTPSADDRAVTRQLVDAGRVLDIPMYDHVVIGSGERYVSFAEAGLL
jgi:DNA repair protein RadC